MPTLPGTGSRLVFVSVKSFGDLLIAATCLARIPPDSRHLVTLLIGEHLAPLVSALSIRTDVRLIDARLDGPAPLFDARRRGPGSAIASALALQKSIGRALNLGETLVFDTLGLRERFLAFGRRSVALPPSRNIYAAYEAFFCSYGIASSFSEPPAPTPRHGGIVRVFTGARMAHRRPSSQLIHRIVHLVQTRGYRAEVVLLEGERPELEVEAFPHVVVPRDFRAMLDVVRQSAAIITPDSMSAHLAEYCGKPSFVVTPVEKLYWMPRFAADNGTISLFNDDLTTGPLNMFLTRYVVG
jgi:hypothetical protein